MQAFCDDVERARIKLGITTAKAIAAIATSPKIKYLVRMVTPNDPKLSHADPSSPGYDGTGGGVAPQTR